MKNNLVLSLTLLAFSSPAWAGNKGAHTYQSLGTKKSITFKAPLGAKVDKIVLDGGKVTIGDSSSTVRLHGTEKNGKMQFRLGAGSYYVIGSGTQMKMLTLY